MKWNFDLNVVIHLVVNYEYNFVGNKFSMSCFKICDRYIPDSDVSLNVRRIPFLA